MAKKLGLKNRSTYQNWEKQTEPDMETLKKIAKILGVQAYKLLEGVIEFFPGEEKLSLVGEEDIQLPHDVAIILSRYDAETVNKALTLLLNEMHKNVK